MADELTFHAWWRPGMSQRVEDVAGGRARATTTLTVHSEPPTGSPSSRAAPAVSFLLAGPRDVAGLQPGAITHRYPERGVPDAEVTMQPYAEFADPGLPWRYTPAINPTGDGPLRPWLVLVVGTPTEVIVQGDHVTLSTDVCRAHPLADSGRHCHVQVADGRTVSRVLSARELAADTDYIAALVPGYGLTGDGDLDDAWTSDGNAVTVACYDHWRFRTGPAGDFRSLARRLAPHAADTFGQAPVEYGRLEDAPDFEIRGALAPLGSVDAKLATEITADLAGLRTPAFDDDAEDGDGRPVVGLPRYGALWADIDTARWGETLNGDPRHRGIAGMGARLAFDEQDSLAEEAGRQAGALEAADQRVRDLACGLAASASLWDRRLPADPAGQLALFGSGLRRVLTDQGSLAARATGAGRPLGEGWFSTAARRALRRGPARTVLAQPQATDPAALLAAGNRCPDPPSFAEVGVAEFDDLGADDFDTTALALAWDLRLPPPTQPDDDPTTGPGPQPIPSRNPWKTVEKQLWSLINPLSDDSWRLTWHLRGRADAGEALPVTAVVQLALQAPQLSQAEVDRKIDELLENTDDWADDPHGLADLMEGLVEDEPEAPPCTPIDVDKLAEGARAAFDPRADNGLARRRVLDGITGLDADQPLTPPEFCPRLDLPVWKLLAEHQPDWLLPGLRTAPEDSVLAVQTNAVFTDALLTGFNTELAGQLRWRNLPVASGCTLVRTFWNRVDPTGGDNDEPTRLDDIVNIAAWSNGSDLGAGQHQPKALSGDDLVVVIRGQLLQRYPQTLIYLVGDDNGDPAIAAEADFPTFRGRLGGDATYLGFRGLGSEDLAGRWLVLEEPPSGFRFRNRVPTDEFPGEQVPEDGAVYAKHTFAPPVRVLIRGDDLIPPSHPESGDGGL